LVWDCTAAGQRWQHKNSVSKYLSRSAPSRAILKTRQIKSNSALWYIAGKLTIPQFK
jgi:hypothetical protein